MKINDIVSETPTFDCKAGLEHVPPQPCRVVYIHPKRRFYVTEFRSAVTGETFRETFYFPERAGMSSDPEVLPRERHYPRGRKKGKKR